MTPEQAAHYQLLRLIEHQPEISQRDLAQAMGVSLGKTHYLLKALLEKGLVKADNFRRSDNKLAYAYLLTPSGIAAKLELTRAFLRLKEQEYEAAKNEIVRLRQELGSSSVPPGWRIYPCAEDLHEALCAHIREVSETAIAERGRFVIVATDGPDLVAFYPSLRRLDTRWDAWQVVVGESVSGSSADESGDYRPIFDAWLSHVPVSSERISALSSDGAGRPDMPEGGQPVADIVLLNLASDSLGDFISAPGIEAFTRGSEIALLAIGQSKRESLGLLARKAPLSLTRLDLRVWADTAAVGC